MTVYASLIPQLQKSLQNLQRWLDKGVEHATAKKYDPSVLLAARLAPDQHPLLRQVQNACDNAKFCAARIAGKQPPSHPDTEQTFDELRARIATVVEYLGTFTPADFEGAEGRLVALPFLQGKALAANDYLLELALPNFHFHLVTAYAILRHSGIDLGKQDFIGSMNLRDA